MDEFEARLRSALAHDRLEFQTGPGFGARIASRTRQRARHRRTARLAGTALGLVVAIGVPMRAGLVGGTTVTQPGALGGGRAESGLAPTGSAGEPGAPLSPDAVGAGSGSHGSTGPDGRRAHAPTHGGSGTNAPGATATARPDGSAPWTRSPVDGGEVTGPSGIATGNAGANTGGNTAIAIGIGVGAARCSISGPEQLVAGEPGTWTSNYPYAAQWNSVLGPSAASPFTYAWDTAGTYTVSIVFRYGAGWFTPCSKSVVVKEVPAGTTALIPAPGADQRTQEPAPDPSATPTPDPEPAPTSATELGAAPPPLP